MNAAQQKAFEELLHKYLRGECTPSEEKIVLEWYDQLTFLSGDHLAENTAFARRGEAYLRSRLPALSAPLPAKVVPLAKRMYLRWSAAAVLAIILTTSLYLFFSPSRPHKPIAVSVITTNHDQLKKITLPDGSVVWLNRFSKLEWTGGFTGTVRLVKITGEALFRVNSDPNRPFIVQAGNTRTHVLGTVFNVEAYTNEQEIKVSLLNGRVQFSGGGTQPPVLLQPGKMVTYMQDSSYCKVTDVINDVSAWTKGFTVFNEVPLTEAITRLANRNGWEVVWKRKYRPANLVSAMFSKETPAQMLQGIAFTYHLKYTVKENRLTIY